MMKCPKCGSTKLRRYGSGMDCDCDDCLHMGPARDFGAECTCAKPHYTPLWWCQVHGEVAVSMD